MNVLIVGGGLLARSLAVTLDEEGHQVSLLDANPDNIELINSDFSGLTFIGFPMDVTLLKEAGIESCDVVAVVTPDDNLNIVIAQIAKKNFNVENVIARISNPKQEMIFHQFGIQNIKTVCPTSMGAKAIMSILGNKV